MAKNSFAIFFGFNFFFKKRLSYAFFDIDHFTFIFNQVGHEFCIFNFYVFYTNKEAPEKKISGSVTSLSKSRPHKIIFLLFNATSAKIEPSSPIMCIYCCIGKSILARSWVQGLIYAITKFSHRQIDYL